MRKPRSLARRLTCLVGAVLLSSAVVSGAPFENRPSAVGRAGGAPDLVRVEGGTFRMGDVFGDGDANERPVHEVTLGPFLIARTEVTVAQFREFVAATAYRTSAEHPENTEGFEKTMARVMAGRAGAGTSLHPGQPAAAEKLLLRRQLLDELDGAAVWDSERNRWLPYVPGTSWRSPGFVQVDEDPVVAVSWDDAVRYCNWLSRAHGLAPAYDETSGALVDSAGRATSDVRAAVGFRLPTEAEWEYAARGGGRELRFGNGKNTARASEINFRADAGEYAYLEKGRSRRGTVPVATLPANALGLHEMSGNAWEWVSDHHAAYDSAASRDPYSTPAAGAPAQQTLRGGRWGGDASEARVFSRSWWLRNDRCNNSGFRVARSLTRR